MRFNKLINESIFITATLKGYQHFTPTSVVMSGKLKLYGAIHYADKIHGGKLTEMFTNTAGYNYL